MSQRGKIRANARNKQQPAMQQEHKHNNQIDAYSSYLIFILIAAEYRLLPTDGKSEGEQEGDCQTDVHYDDCVMLC